MDTAILTPEQKEHVRALCDDLESGLHEQGKFYLHVITAAGVHRWCCLGRACMVALARGCEITLNSVPLRYTDGETITVEKFGDATETLPKHVAEWFGFDITNPVLAGDDGLSYNATHLNDLEEGYDLPAIGRAFRRTYLGGDDADSAAQG